MTNRKPKPTIHYLYSAITPCNLRGIPCDWPPANSWSDDWSQVNCLECLKYKPGAIICPCCDEAMPSGCGGTFKFDTGKACMLNDQDVKRLREAEI